MEAPVALVDQTGEREEVGVEELRQLPPLLDDGHDRVVVADRAEHARVGRVAGLPLAAGRETELLEQDARELLRRAELELLAREVERARLELLDPLVEPGGDLAHAIRVDPDARVLHVREHGGERQLDLVVEPLHPPLPHPGSKRRREPPRRLGVPHERRRLLLGRGIGNELEAVLPSEVVELVAGPARVDEVRGDQRVVRRSATEAEELRVVRKDLRVAQHAAELLQGALDHQHLVGRGEPPAAVMPRHAEDFVLTQHELLPRRLTPGDGHLVGLERLCRGKRRIEGVHPAQQTAELEATEDLLERRAVGRCRHELGRVDAERQVAAHGREELRVPRLVGVLPHGSAAGRRQLVGVGDDLLERAVLRDQLAGGLVADAGDAWDVVRRVALEPDEVRHLVGPDAVAELDALGRVDVHLGDAARRHHQRDVLAAELERIAVGRDDARLDAGLVGPGRDRRDHVVGLPALELEVSVPERLDDRTEVRELLPQEVRHRTAALLVGLRDLGAVGRPRVPGDGDAARRVVGEQLEEHVREAEQRVRRLAVGRLQLLGEREVRPVGEVVAVHEEELGALRRTVVELELVAGQRLRAHRASLTWARETRSSAGTTRALPCAPTLDTWL